jgi:hypothetical protein
MLGSAVSRSSYATKVDVPLDQPVPFSHQHHVNELGIDCRYCHQSVEKSAWANVPPTHTCMSCHSQIWTNSPLLEPVRESYRTGEPIRWNKVNGVPHFVYFDHSIHIKRGVSCNVCHGPIQAMQITYKANPFWMKWCLDCHREPEKYVRKESVFDLYYKEQTGQPVTAEERALLDGKEYRRTPAELAEGRRLVKQYGINTKQLTDCWICHR